MKQTFLFAAVVISFFISSTAFAKIWRVNNNSGINADFTTAQQAANAANPKDTLHFEPSANSYGFLHLTKRLVLIGIGDFPTIDTGEQVRITPAFLDSILIDNANADSSKIMVSVGKVNLQATPNPTIIAGTVRINNVNNVIITRCFIGAISLNNANRTTITQTFLGLADFTELQIASCNYVVVTNNMFWRKLNMSGNCSNNIIMNNVFAIYNYGQSGESNIIGSVFQNNIIVNPNSNGYSFDANCIVQRNISSQNTFANTGTNISNLNNVNMDSIFVKWQVNFDSSYRLKTTVISNPAIGYGIGGVDCGAFGGATPYKLGVQPSIPSIYKLVVPGATSNILKVTFSTKSHN